jgi:transcriptional regulator NrdR family protein
MSVYIDRKFLLQVSPKLLRFTQKKTDLYNFRCPFCGDSQKNKLKARGFIYRKKNDYFYSCHNCHVGHTFYNFLKFIDANLVREYSLERYKDGETGHHNYTKPTFDIPKPVFKQKIELDSIESLPDNHFAKQYMANRQIPKERWTELYFAPDFKLFVESFGIEKDLKTDDPRLIIPFYNAKKDLIGFQGRALSESKIRYITIKLDEDAPKIFGLDRLKSGTTYVVEGPIDSMFIDNAIATADANLSSIDSEHFNDLVLIYDNEPRNKDIIKQIAKAIKEQFQVVIWPATIESKDINEMILSGLTKDNIMSIIKEHTYSGLRAEMELKNWSKV